MNDVTLTLEQILKDFADGIERLAFSIPPPNEYTPQFVQMAIEARNLSSRAHVESGWQPIETAPWETPVWTLWDGINNKTGKPARYYDAAYLEPETGRWIRADGFGYELDDTPTHWRKLPEPPGSVTSTSPNPHLREDTTGEVVERLLEIEQDDAARLIERQQREYHDLWRRANVQIDRHTAEIEKLRKVLEEMPTVAYGRYHPVHSQWANGYSDGRNEAAHAVRNHANAALKGGKV